MHNSLIISHSTTHFDRLLSENTPNIFVASIPLFLIDFVVNIGRRRIGHISASLGKYDLTHFWRCLPALYSFSIFITLIPSVLMTVESYIPVVAIKVFMDIFNSCSLS